MSTHQEWIHNLLDGELDSMNESALFGEFAVNSDLRTEFKQQLAIRSAVHDDRVGLIPPVALTNTLFSGMGFAAPLAGAAAGAAGGGLLLQWLTRLGLPILTTIAAAGITWGVVSNNGSSSQTTVVTGPVGQSPAQVIEAPIVNSVKPAMDGESARLRREIAALRMEKAQLKSQLRELRASAESVPPEVAAEPAMYSSPPIGTVQMNNTISLTHTNEPRMMQVASITPMAIRTIQYPSLLVQLRGMSGNSLTDVSVPTQTSWLDNISVGFLYQLSDRNAVGVEFGNESFAMSFEGTRNGQSIHYEQQPLSTWAGVTYRHTLPTIGKTAFAPFGQVLLGGTKFGPLGRLSAGITYAPAGPLSFIFALEGSTMAYQFQNAWFGTSKIGLTYGVAVRF
ncbi:MAG: hypothetical protein NTX15_10825 [Candidatus Kapabacteria bacterium]|nr:hypothetical protein [Candidatus Kapabacteria bacterium]